MGRYAKSHNVNENYLSCGVKIQLINYLWKTLCYRYEHNKCDAKWWDGHDWKV